MSLNLLAQMVGFHHNCIEYDSEKFQEYYAYLYEADEFGAAAAVYEEERDELLANAAHRYQLLIDWMTERLKLNISFLNKEKIWFNFYADIATRFGVGTQAYTTETKKPHIGVSEISLQDLYLLQLILIHEVQHATDFVNYSGLEMSVSERELRARISICQALTPLVEPYPELFNNAVLDECYWYIILFLSPSVRMPKKEDYYNLLETQAREKLQNDDEGVVFTPMVIRALGKELMRENVKLFSNTRYTIHSQNGLLKLIETPLNLDKDEFPESEIDLIEEIMLQNDDAIPSSAHVQDISHEDLEDLTLDYSRDTPTTKNKVTDWQPYDHAYEKLKEKATIVIQREKKTFHHIHTQLNEALGDIQIQEPLTPQALDHAVNLSDSQSLKDLNNIVIPEAVLETDESEEANESGEVPVHLQPLQSGVPKRHNINNDIDVGEDIVSNLSDFVKEKGNR